MRMLLILATVCFLVADAADALSAGPDSLSFQGRLTNLAGDPINANDVSITFTIYKGANPVWMETQLVDVVDGIYNVYLGAVTPLGTVAFDQAMELGVKVDSEPDEILPRIPLVSGAFARALPGLYTFRRSGTTLSFPSEAFNIVGGEHHTVGPTVVGATISGGGGTVNGSPLGNDVLGDFGAVGGGYSNTAGDEFATVAGGRSNNASGSSAFIGGGNINVASASTTVVAGGSQNQATGLGSFVGSGQLNMASGGKAFIGGGQENEATGGGTVVGGGVQNEATADYAFIGGGNANIAAGLYAAIAGGSTNEATGLYAAVAGGHTNEATGKYATIPGGFRNAARGEGSFAGGTQARANHTGSFVWQDRTGGLDIDDTLSTTADNQFLVRAAGGTTFYSAITPDVSTGVTLAPGSGAWAPISDVTAKTGFEDVDAHEILDRLADIPIQKWRYRMEPSRAMHLGPTAQDFHKAFGLGPDDRHIVTVDADGVALTAIQAVYELVKEQQAEIERMRAVMERAGLE